MKIIGNSITNSNNNIASSTGGVASDDESSSKGHLLPSSPMMSDLMIHNNNFNPSNLRQHENDLAAASVDDLVQGHISDIRTVDVNRPSGSTDMNVDIEMEDIMMVADDESLYVHAAKTDIGSMSISHSQGHSGIDCQSVSVSQAGGGGSPSTPHHQHSATKKNHHPLCLNKNNLHRSNGKAKAGTSHNHNHHADDHHHSSSSNNKHSNHHTGKHHHTINSILSNKGGGSRFRGLSRSAFNLLSQDDQTLSELLTVDVEDVNVNVNVNVSSSSAVGGGVVKNSHATNVGVDRRRKRNGSGGGGGTSSRNPVDLPPLGQMSVSTAAAAGVEHVHISRHAAVGDEEDDSLLLKRYQRRIRELEEQLHAKEQERLRQTEELELRLQQHTKTIVEKTKIILKMEEQRESSLNSLKKYDSDGLEKQQQTRNCYHDHDNNEGEKLQPAGQRLPLLDEEIVNSRVVSLTPSQIARYSRQLLLNDGWGVAGQHKLQSSSVLVIGAGGIGSTLLLYLASSGVGNITVVDFDTVDRSNLHRQVIHSEQMVGRNKALSACEAMRRLNPTVKCTAVTDMLTYDNAMEYVSKHDVVIDACDNPQTRYLVNDACVLSRPRKPLVSGSAMGTEGQLTVYCHGEEDSPCYRCLYPRANPAEGGKSCSDNGVLGPVPGLIGILQAIETLKVLTGTGTTMHDKLVMYDSLRCSFLGIKKGKRRSNCAVCGADASIASLADSQRISSAARGPQQCGMPLGPTGVGSGFAKEWNVTCKEYYQIRKRKVPHVLLDVRVRRQYELCTLKGSINVPLASLEDQVDYLKTLTENGSKAIYCLCRRGIASAEATKMLVGKNVFAEVYNVKGGLNAWMADVDPLFPMY